MHKNRAFPKEQGAKEGKGRKNSATDCHGSETKLLEDDVEDEDENGPHASGHALEEI